MFCPNCEKEISDDALFCTFCGYSIINETDDKVHCPNCDSTDVIVNKKGYNTNAIGCSLVLIILGLFTYGIAWLVVIILLLSGFLGSNKMVWFCKKCGYQWKL